jgi:hypothetical protein
MLETLLVTTSSEGLKPLGTPAQRSFELITATLRHALGDAAAELFAEPVATQHGDRFDWYAPSAGAASRLDALDPAAQAEARDALAALRGQIAAYAETRRGARNAEDDRLAEALSNALEVPGDDFIFVLAPAQPGGAPRPVLVNWAWVADHRPTERGRLTGVVARRRDPAPTAPAAPPRAAPIPAATVAAAPAAAEAPAGARSGLAWLFWLGWLLLLLMLAAILYLAIAPCGLRGLGLLDHCPGPAAARSEVLDRNAQLDNRIAQLERRIGEAGRACRPVPPPPVPDFPAPAPAAPAPATPAPSEIDERLDRAGAQRGALSFSLAWDTIADLDLHVTCPAGATISYNNRAACNGQLDVDANVNPRLARRDPVENVFYNSVTPGSYQVRVNLYDPAVANGPVAFRLQIRDGDRVELLEGSVSPTQPNWRGSYTPGQG